MRIRQFKITTLTLVALLPMLPIQGQVIHTVAGVLGSFSSPNSTSLTACFKNEALCQGTTSVMP